MFSPIPATVHEAPLLAGCAASACTFLYTRSIPKTACAFVIASGLSYALARVFLPIPVIRPIPFEGCHSVGVKFMEAGPNLPRYAVFYPTKHNGPIDQVSWVPWGDFRYVTEFAKNMRVPSFLFNHFGRIKIEAAHNASSMPESAHRYIIFSHGLHGHQSMYTTIAMELASRGFHVVCPEHTDGSAAFTLDAKGNPITFTNVTGMSNDDQLIFRSKQLNHRTKEIFGLMEHATPNAKEIILSGHSFGGCSALNAICELSIRKAKQLRSEAPSPLLDKYAKVEHAMLFDLWPFAMTGIEGQSKIDQLKTIALNSPYMKRDIPEIILYNSEDWDEWEEFKAWEHKNFFTDSRLFPAFFKTLFLPYSDHYSISDMGLFTPFAGRKKFPYGRHGATHISQWADELGTLCK